ncbi:MAG: hypothetical protein ACKOCB_09815 [Planctomycetia bacterium]
MRRVMSIASLLVPALSLALAGCASRPAGGGNPNVGVRVAGSDLGARLDRSDWMVREGGQVWRVLESRTVNGETRPPVLVGYLEARDYRQAKGGPTLRLYEVTGLDRRTVLGRIDSVGKIVRYEVDPATHVFTQRDLLPAPSREDNVGAILGSPHPILLQATTARRIAFDTLDRDSNGVLSAEELVGTGTRISSGDANGDKIVDYAEFQALERL